MTTAFAADSLDSTPRRTAGIAQFSYLVDLASGVAGFLVVAAVAPLAGTYLLGGASSLLFVLYGLTLLATTTETTSIALLQLAGRFGAIGRLTLARELMRVIFVVLALLLTRSIEGVIVGLFLMETAMAVLWGGRCEYRDEREVRRCQSRATLPSETRGMRKDMVRMVMHTNVVSYVKLLAAQGPTLLLGGMRTPAEAGIFKIGTSIAAVVGKPADPAWAAVLPRLAKLRAAGRDPICGRSSARRPLVRCYSCQRWERLRSCFASHYFESLAAKTRRWLAAQFLY